jgi:hypothetical protein
VSILASDSEKVALARGVVGDVGRAAEVFVGVVGTAGSTSGIGAITIGGVAIREGSGEIRSMMLSSVL